MEKCAMRDGKRKETNKRIELLSQERIRTHGEKET